MLRTARNNKHGGTHGAHIHNRRKFDTGVKFKQQIAVCARASGARIPYRVQVVNDERVYWMAIIAEDGGLLLLLLSEEDMLYVSDAPAHFF